jgi:hypothetical protein
MSIFIFPDILCFVDGDSHMDASNALAQRGSRRPRIVEYVFAVVKKLIYVLRVKPPVPYLI